MGAQRQDAELRPSPAARLVAGCERALAQLELALSAAGGAGTVALAITSARHALDRLREDAAAAESRFLSLLDAVPEAVTVHDREGRIVIANEAAGRLFGYPPERLSRLSVYDLNPSLPPHHMDEVWRSHVPGQTSSVETTNVRSDGRRFPVEVHSNVYREGGEPHVVAVARDIGVRRQVESALRASEERYRQLLNSVDKGILVSDPRGRIVSANAAAERILGLGERELREDVMRKEAWSLVDADGARLDWNQVPAARALAGGMVIDSTLVGVYSPRMRGITWLSTTAVPQFLTGQRVPFQVITLFSDVTALKRQSELARETAALAQIGAFERDFLREQLYHSEELARLIDWPAGHRIDWGALLALFPPDHADRLRDAAERVRQGGPPFELDLKLVSRRGHVRWVRVQGRAIVVHGLAHALAATVQDITARRQQEEQLRRQALTDPLTGLANRDALLHGLAGALREAGTRPGPSLLYVDLDRFKVINDLLGHAAGDGLLVAAAERLRQAAGDAHLIARFGGDEFMIVVAADEDLVQRTEALAVRITDAFDRPFEYAGEDFTITASVGIARHPDDGTSVQQLINHADAAMYEAKRRGRNQWQGFSPQLARALTDRLMIETQLRRALDHGEFHLLFQPQVELASGRPVAAEALLRWNSRVLGALMPDVFVPHAENTGDIVRIGAWVIREACRQLRAWTDSGLALSRIAVNVSYRQFLSENLVEVVSEALACHGLPGSALELELTERVLIEDVPDTIATFDRLKQLGVQLVIDDFGEGYSALNTLRRLPFDALKISHHFMQGIPGNEEDSAILDAIIRMADALRVNVIAEGVERVEQRSFLVGHGARYAQGFLFARPLPPDELVRYVQAGNRHA